MGEGRNIPLIIMLLAGTVISIACIVFKVPLLQTLLYVLLTLIAFYLIGLIVKNIILSVNKDAENRAVLLKQEEAEAKLKEATEKKELTNGDAEAEPEAQEESVKEL